MREVQHDSDLSLRRGGTESLHGPAVRQEKMVRRGDRFGFARAARRVLAPGVADPRDDPRLVVGRPMGDPVAKTRRHRGRVLDERLCGRARGPAALVLEGLRRVPVEERRERRDPFGEQGVDEPVVEVEPALVHLPATFGQDPRPRDGEAERVEPEVAHEGDVVGIAVIEVARDRARVAAANLAGRRAEPVPDALAAAVGGGGALDLVRGRGRTPEEVGRERACGRHGCPLSHDAFAKTASGAGALT